MYISTPCCKISLPIRQSMFICPIKGTSTTLTGSTTTGCLKGTPISKYTSYIC